ncbi:cytochrome b5-like heme steroid binding domain containing protein [Stylonychia lemnae]|uniref:Cytochrome b5-like heme steroid binding domain containing protein n=1 Tax=Stylonychia lemnae TaxID=5949 RepID=A0A078B5Q6_STYLE|nr:cytochrome b5-like heme steroid binding domain containing protein [Stylonychia lemnae]|eukprot:CDW89749.1 cytochrome b5-like heme steroid binding domain containing protein [Stylonychia lemnae]
MNYQEGSQARIEILNKTYIRYNVQIKKGQYLAFGYGYSMKNVDMVIFQSSTIPQVLDLYSNDEAIPQIDSQQDYISNFTTNSTHVNFVATRLLETTDSNDKVIKLGEALPMVWAYSILNSNLIKHEGKGSFEIYVSNAGINYQRETTFIEWDNLLMVRVHGWFLWFTWSLLSYIQMAVNRYLKIFWKVNMWIHRIVGTLILILTIIMSIVGFRNHKHIFEDLSGHHVIGIIIFFSVNLLVASGIIARSRQIRLKWKTSKILIFKNIHKIYGKLMYLLGQVGVLTGILHYNNRIKPETILWLPNADTFLLSGIFVEIMYQVYRNRESPFKKSQMKITIQDFEARVRSGQKLVLLDDLVLDISKFMESHPGGKFSLEANIGRDVSKFFYGGYSMENYSQFTPLHSHSNIARYIVNGLIIAQLDTQVIPEVANMRFSSSSYVKTLTQTIVLEREDGKEVGFHKFFKDIQMIGKYYLVRKRFRRQFVNRHYTVANCMEPKAYEVYLEILKGNKSVYFENQELFQQKVGGSFSITSKNYKTKSGVSRRLHEFQTDIFQVQGPLGKGLQIQSSGLHIAFTAGTGILAFVDLVAHLIRKNFNLLTPEEDSQINIEEFRFILYASFKNEEDSIAYEMCQGLQNYCRKNGLKNFQFNVRFSDANLNKWDYGFIEYVLGVNQDIDLQRLWVCGPPKMNEDFHKALENLVQNNFIESSQYEIL